MGFLRGYLRGFSGNITGFLESNMARKFPSKMEVVIRKSSNQTGGVSSMPCLISGQ